MDCFASKDTKLLSVKDSLKMKRYTIKICSPSMILVFVLSFLIQGCDKNKDSLKMKRYTMKICSAPMFLVFVLSFLIQGCDKNTDESKVSFKIIPSRPKVIDAPYNIGDLELGRPWFLFRFSGKNDSDKTLTISRFDLLVTGSTGTGAEKATEQKHYRSEDIGDGNYHEGRDWLHIVDPGQSFEETAVLAVAGLPEDSDFVYEAELTFIGWFNQEDDPNTDIDEAVLPQDNFEKEVRFRTK